MDRLTQRSNAGEGLPIKHLNLMHMDTTSEDTLTEILDRLAEYENIGLTPEQIKAQQQNLDIAYKVIGNLEKERNFWEREAIEAKAQLGEIRIRVAQEEGN